MLEKKAGNPKNNLKKLVGEEILPLANLIIPSIALSLPLYLKLNYNASFELGIVIPLTGAIIIALTTLITA